MTTLINFISSFIITFISILKLPIFSKQLNFYVDVDGTLLDPSLDKTFNHFFSINDNTTINWYTHHNFNTLKLNYSLIINLFILKLLGHKLILWTNRRPNNILPTYQNLKSIWFLFSDYQFHSGGKDKKTTFLPNSFIIDNETRYTKLIPQSILIQFNNTIQPHHITNNYSVDTNPIYSLPTKEISMSIPTFISSILILLTLTSCHTYTQQDLRKQESHILLQTTGFQCMIENTAHGSMSKYSFNSMFYRHGRYDYISEYVYKMNRWEGCLQHKAILRFAYKRNDIFDLK